MQPRSSFKLTYNVDLVLCIDATYSMDHIIDTVKRNALNLHQDIINKMREKNKVIEGLRVRVIGFRDYLEDGDDAMLVSDFFSLPEEARSFEQCMGYVDADGGGDIPEDGLEALAYAIRSPWERSGTKKRHVVVLWTDADAHPLGYGKASPAYPGNMAADLEELTQWWQDRQMGGYMDRHAKRLLMFAPSEGEDGQPTQWKRISETWDNAVIMPVESESGLEDWQYEEILAAICNTI